MKFSFHSAFLAFLFCILFHYDTSAQAIQDTTGIENIFRFMDETTLPLDKIKKLAEEYFRIHGTARGSGYKQYQRWLYERKFHVDAEGYLIDPEIEFREYDQFMRRSASPERGITQAWTDLGPFSWTYTSGWNPGVGRITSVASISATPNTIYVSSPGGGIWKTTNGGSTWIPLVDVANSAWMKIFHLTIDPGNNSGIYASVMGGGVIKSLNAGSTWAATGSGPVNTRKVLVNPNNSNIVLATAGNGIYRSTNGGTTWTQVSTMNAEDIEFKPGNVNIVYASGTSVTFNRSTDNGLTWTPVGAANGITNSGRSLIGVSAANPSVVYVVQADGNVFGRMYKSTDSGLNFITTVIGNYANGTNYFGYSSAGNDNVGQAGYDMAICVNPTNAEEVHIAGIICWKSTNGGYAFTAETEWAYPNGTGYNHADVHALEWVGSTIYSGSDGGIYKSTNNGGDWTDLTSGIGIRQIYRISNAKTNANVITIGAQDNGSTFRQNSGTWVDWLGADGMDNMISPTSASVAYGTSQFGSLYKTTNSGASYNGLPVPGEGNWVTPVCMHPTDQNTIYGGWLGVYKSTNGGTAWSNISSGYINRKLDLLAVAAFNTDYIYAAATDKLFRTQNGGVTWDSVAMGQIVNWIFVSTSDPLKIWVALNATSSQVMYSSNGGNTFTNIATGLPGIVARSVVIDEANANGVYVGMNIGVYYKNDLNPVWTAFGTSLPLVGINEIELQQSGNKVRVATYGRGVWENSLEIPPCSSLVVNTSDSGLGSLRSAVGCTTGSDTITFSPSLIGQFIDTGTDPIIVNRNIKILQTAASIIKIRTVGGGPIFSINPGKTAFFRYVDLYGGTAATARAILNQGILTLHHVTINDNLIGNGSLIQNNGSLSIDGVVNVKN